MRAFTQRTDVLGDVRVRLLVVICLATLGVGLAVTGSALGVGDGAPSSGGGPAVSIDEDITLADADGEVTVIDDVSSVRAVEVDAAEDGTIRFRTERRDGLTADERTQAKAIARNNETVRRAIDRLAAPEIGVEPVVTLDASAAETASVSETPTDVEGDDTAGTSTYEFTVNATSVEERDGSVVVDRDPSYAEGVAVVRVRDSAGESRYSITVDLGEEAVTKVTDWERIRDGG